jgi:hypothetical protein
MPLSVPRYRLPIAGVLTLGLVAVGCGDTSGPGEVRVPIVVDSVRVAPLVTRPGETFTLALRVAGVSGDRVHAYATVPSGLRVDGEPLDSLVLRDDGSGADARPSDGWFTAEGVELPPGVSVRVPIRTADPQVVGAPAVHVLAEDARATSRVIALSHPAAGVADEEGLTALARRYYELLPDDRDFLVVFTPPSVGGSWSARAYQIRNDVAGIGLDLADWRDVGSADRLDLVVHSRVAGYSLRDGTGNFCVLNHELAHRWMAYLGDPLTDGPHWEAGALDRTTSALGDSVGCVFNDLELYLAGFVPLDSVADPVGRNGYTTAGLRADHGPRRPAYGAAPRDFTIGFIVVTEAPATDHALAYFHHVAGEYTAASTVLGVNWTMSTGGRSTLRPDLPLATLLTGGGPGGNLGWPYQ